MTFDFFLGHSYLQIIAPTLSLHFSNIFKNGNFLGEKEFFLVGLYIVKYFQLLTKNGLLCSSYAVYSGLTHLAYAMLLVCWVTSLHLFSGSSCTQLDAFTKLK